MTYGFYTPFTRPRPVGADRTTSTRSPSRSFDKKWKSGINTRIGPASIPGTVQGLRTKVAYARLEYSADHNYIQSLQNRYRSRANSSLSEINQGCLLRLLDPRLQPAAWPPLHASMAASSTPGNPTGETSPRTTHPSLRAVPPPRGSARRNTTHPRSRSATPLYEQLP